MTCITFHSLSKALGARCTGYAVSAERSVDADASFIICTVIGFGVGFAGFELLGTKDATSTIVPTETAANTETNDTSNAVDDGKQQEEQKKAEPETISANSEILSNKGCLGCHSVSSLNLQGGATGPDLSQAFNNVNYRQSKPIDEFLKEPTSAVMSTVIGGSPLENEEIEQIVKALQEAAEK